MMMKPELRGTVPCLVRNLDFIVNDIYTKSGGVKSDLERVCGVSEGVGVGTISWPQRNNA